MEEDQLIYPFSTDSEDEGNPHQLAINEHYAKAFQYRKEREELTKLKEKYGSDADTDDASSGDSDSESDESEDEDGEELTPALDAAILRTLARIKTRDPDIYDADRHVFDEEHDKSGALPAPTRAKKAKAPKPVTLPEHRLAAALDIAASRSASPEAPSPPPTHVAEQAALRAETVAAFHSSAGDAEQDEEGGLFILREKTRDEVEREEAEYRAYLEREVGPLEQILDLGGEESKVEDEMRPQDVGDAHAHPAEADPREKKGKKKKGKKIEEERKVTDQEFLINYILHRGWIDRSARRVPTYKEITVGAASSKDPDPPATRSGADVDAEPNGILLEDDDEFDEVAEHFESSYNFRFEEPEASHISSFPRTVESVRRQTERAERRRATRERRRERKEAEKAHRREEVRRLKGLKTREVEAKLERIGKEGGWAHGQALQELDIDGDWDAEAHDRQMAAVLAETDGAGDDEKPTWDDDIDVGDIIPPSVEDASLASATKERKKAKKKEKKKKREDDQSAVGVDEMDADAINEDEERRDDLEWDGTEEMRKRVLDQYMEELYGLEFNDMVAGMPTRFGYTPVAKTTYALTSSEILLADDKDLNEYVGLKKLAPYRKQGEAWDAKRTERLREFKHKVSARLGDAGADIIATEYTVDGERKAKKRKGKKERMREKATRTPEEAEMAVEVGTKATDPPGQSNKHAEWRSDDEEEDEASEPVKKKRRRQKRAGKPQTVE